MTISDVPDGFWDFSTTGCWAGGGDGDGNDDDDGVSAILRAPWVCEGSNGFNERLTRVAAIPGEVQGSTFESHVPFAKICSPR